VAWRTLSQTFIAAQAKVRFFGGYKKKYKKYKHHELFFRLTYTWYVLESATEPLNNSVINSLSILIIKLF